jgi:predicted GIY-YIG superfamily endonuclease
LDKSLYYIVKQEGRMNKNLYFAIYNRTKHSIKPKKGDDDKYLYGLFKEEQCFYIGKTNDLKRRLRDHKRKNGECIMKELKKPNNDYNWEKIYIQWYGLKYKLDNKEYKLQKISYKDKCKFTDDLPKKFIKNQELEEIIKKYHLIGADN